MKQNPVILLLRSAFLCGILALSSCSAEREATPEASAAEVASKTKEGYKALREGDPEKALACADEALRLDPGTNADATAKAHVLRAVVFTTRNQPDLAIEAANKAIKAKKDAPYA